MKEMKKIANLEYNEIITLGVIEADEDLNNLFKEEIKLPFNILIRFSKEGKLNDDAKELLVEFFDKIILTKEHLIKKYMELSTNSKDVSEDVSEPFNKSVNSIIEAITEVKEENSKPIFKGEIKDVIKDVKTPKKDKKLPRRYGKVLILRDIEKQGGKATPVQNAMLKVNELKNTYVTLSNRGISDMIGGTKLLSDADCRDIVASITIVQRKLEEVLKRKK